MKALAPDLSIIFGTYNRLGLLMQCLLASREAASPLEVEFIIAAIGDDTDTIEFLRTQSDVKLILHEQLHGAARAFNDCAIASSADFVCHLNDDALPLDDCLLRAYQYISDARNVNVGQVSLAWRNIFDPPTVPFSSSLHLGRHTADFGITKREIGEAAGWFNPHLFKTYGTDLELSFRIMQAGYEVHLLRDCRVMHWHYPDNLRDKNLNDRKAIEVFENVWQLLAANLPETKVIELPYWNYNISMPLPISQNTPVIFQE